MNNVSYFLSFMEVCYEISGCFYLRLRVQRLSLCTEEAQPTLSILDHKELAPGLLRRLIQRAGLTVEEFLKKK